MPVHRYRIGQMVELDPMQTLVPADGRTYKILQLLPEAWGDVQYRIKSVVERLDRVVKESEFGAGNSVRSVIWDRIFPDGRRSAPPLASRTDSERTDVTGAQHKTDHCEQDIHVGLDRNNCWYVARGGERSALASYRFRGHAIAYARAEAFSRHVEMIVHDCSGGVVRHQRASLTYPALLD